jgi:hypothetical protein
MGVPVECDRHSSPALARRNVLRIHGHLLNAKETQMGKGNNAKRKEVKKPKKNKDKK